MVRSTATGTTEIRSLGDPPTLRPSLKRNPEAFLSRRIVINEGKTEYGVALRLLQEWDGDPQETLPSAALGVVAIEGSGGTGSCKWAEEFLGVGYEVVLFIDSDEPDANAMVPGVRQLGGTVVQWPDGACIESAVCAQLDEIGLNDYIAAALEASDDPDGSRQSFTDNLRKYAVVDGVTPESVDTLDMSTWTAAGIGLNVCRTAVSEVSKSKGWFKRVDKGQRLGTFILETPVLQTAPIRTILDELHAAVYTTYTVGQSLTEAIVGDAHTEEKAPSVESPGASGPTDA